RRFWSKVGSAPEAERWTWLVRSSASDPAGAAALPPFSLNFNLTQSRGLKLGVLELETFSARTRWRSWCHCIRVRSADKAGRSLMDIAPSFQSPLRPDAASK